jgi:hypothetical protein
MNWKVISSIGMFVLTVSGIVVYDQVIKDQVLSTEVVVAKERIDKHTKFSKSNLVVERRTKGDLVDGYIKPDKLNELYGKDANTLILENQMISNDFVEFENLTPDPSKDEAIRPIPSNWIYAMPGSLRRKDIISIYPVKDEEAPKSQEEQSIRTIDDNNTLTEDEANNASPDEVASRFKPILEYVAVNYVKTSSNQEVTNEKDSKERLNASGTATDIEVNITEDQLKTLVQAIDEGYKLYISYR